MNTILKLSEQLLYNIKFSLPYDEEVLKLSKLNFDNFLLEIDSDNTKKAFWLNIYNGFYQILAKNHETKIDKTFYSTKSICIASKKFSLDTIEHGILRKGKFVTGFGFLYNPFYSRTLKKLQVKNLDYRIHFALNCGAISCPPILIYKYEKIENQLKLATDSFITSETSVDSERKLIKISRLFLWYFRDFGTSKSIKQIIGTSLNLNLLNYRLTFQKYNWTAQLHNFK